MLAQGYQGTILYKQGAGRGDEGWVQILMLVKARQKHKLDVGLLCRAYLAEDRVISVCRTVLTLRVRDNYIQYSYSVPCSG